jgi:hypothetical protein
MKSLVTALFALALIVCRSEAEALRDVEIVEFGVFSAIKSQGYVDAPNAIAGKSHAGTEATLIESTTTIHASVGTSFGILVKFIGEPDGEVVPCMAKCLHPKFTDPSSQRSSEVEQWENRGTIGGAGYIGYTFDNSWELVPGQWTIQIFVGSKLRAEKTFNVIVSGSAG